MAKSATWRLISNLLLAWFLFLQQLLSWPLKVYRTIAFATLLLPLFHYFLEHLLCCKSNVYMSGTTGIFRINEFNLDLVFGKLCSQKMEKIIMHCRYNGLWKVTCMRHAIDFIFRKVITNSTNPTYNNDLFFNRKYRTKLQQRTWFEWTPSLSWWWCNEMRGNNVSQICIAH